MTLFSRFSTLALVLTSLLAGCASTPKITPADAVEQAGTALQRARENHVDDYAAPELRIARTKYAAAQNALQGKKPELATPLAQEAEVSTQLATVEAEGARANANRLSVQRAVNNMEHLAHPSTGGDSGDNR